MHDYLYRPEVARIALVLGVVISILFYERTQLTTGGAIVPAYLALFLPEPLHVVTTLVVAYVTYLLVNRVFARRWILYGRRKFEVEVLTGLALLTVTTLLAVTLGPGSTVWYGLSGVGMLVPGLVAHDMFRQTPRQTLIAVSATTAIVALAIYLFASLLDISTLKESRLPRVGDETGYPTDLLLAAAVLSVLAGLVTFSVLGLRSGGFISAAYLALFATRPLDLVWAATMALVTWVLVTRVVMPNLLIFGRRKLSAMLLVGSIVCWTAETVVITATNGAVQPWKGFVLISLMVPSLLANDAQRQGPERTLWGAGIATLVVYGGTNVLYAALIPLGLA